MPLSSPSQGGVVNATDVSQLVNLLTATMTDQPVTIANRVRAQATGATAGTGGYVGATVIGPPTSGTFNVGDFLVDAAGTVWVCTTAGTPGTWITPGLGVISEQSLGSSAATVTFSAIPANFKHLLMMCSLRSTVAGTYVDTNITFNADSANNYAWTGWSILSTGASSVAVNGSGAAAFIAGPTSYAAGVSPTSAFGSAVLWLPNYATTTQTKTLFSLSAAMLGTSISSAMRFGGWNSSSAVTSITFTASAGSWATNSFFGLYGMP
jgi:hypothetical protein